MGRLHGKVLFVAGLAAALAVGGPAGAEEGAFEATADMAGGARASHFAVRLADGLVLVGGGSDETSSSALASAELYGPGDGTFTATGSLAQGRIFATAHLLPDGRALALGGAAGGAVFASTEIYDPGDGTFSAGPSMAVARSSHASVALGDGRVLAIGGFQPNTALLTAEVYDPSAGSGGAWSATGSMAARRLNFPAVRMGDGRVLVVGGASGPEGSWASLSSCEIWDPDTGAFTAAASLPGPRSSAAAVALADGRVLVAGGGDGTVSLHDALVYDPEADSWSAPMAITAGGGGTSATLLADGRVLVAGGWDAQAQVESPEADLFDPSTGAFSPLPPMVDGRTNHAATLLADGRVLLAGGNFRFAPGIGHALASAELFVPGDPNEPPVADAGEDFSVECTSADGATVALDGTGSSDPDGDGLSFAWSGVFGTAEGAEPEVTLPPGMHAITLAVSDGRGGVAMDEVVVTVEDTTAPVFEAIAADPAVLWPPRHQMVSVTIAATATDSCGDEPDVRILSVSSNEAVDGRGDGCTSPDWEVTGDLTLDLRAERSGRGRGRVYTVTLVATDDSGNETTGTVQVVVPKSRKRCGGDGGDDD
jgi:hypothetical protein